MEPAEGSQQFSTLKLMEECQRHMNPQDNAIFTSEIALNVDLVVKSLFRFMDCTTLKSCRLVCRLWKYFGAKELQRRKCITVQLYFGSVIDKSENSAQSLLTLMQNAEANTFPCASFHVSTEELSFPLMQHFLSVAEAQNRIKKLSMVLNYEKKELLWEESTLLEDLRDLLFCQVPNLEDLAISFILPMHWDVGLSTLDSGFFHLKNSPQLLPKLTSLDLSGTSIPRKLFEDVMDVAVNLQTYAGFDLSPEQLRYFLDGNGRLRIHLLKHLSFEFTGAFIEVMERLVGQHGDDLKLESFFFFNSLTRLNDGAEFGSRASSVISQLFLSSTSTMKRIGITPMRFLPGLAIPRLPSLGCMYVDEGFIGDENDIANTFFFPSGFSLAKKLPNLSIVSFIKGSTLKLLEMLSITEPVTSVKHIWITDKDEIDDDTRALLYGAFPSVVQIKEGI